MLKKGQKAFSILKGKCPRCHEGDFFESSFTIHPARITKLHSNCSHCELKYMMEPSFFYGAMYVNYALTVIILVTAFVITKVLLKLELSYAFIISIAALIILAPINLRLSRILWINLFITYDKSFDKS